MGFARPPRPDMPSRNPLKRRKLARSLRRGGGRRILPGSGMKLATKSSNFGMLACGLAVLGTLALIVYELVLRSGPSWHAFGFEVFLPDAIGNPVNEQFRRAAIHLRNPGFIAVGSDYCGTTGGWSGSIHY